MNIPIIPDDPPTITFIPHVDRSYNLAGWDELNRWGLTCHPSWSQTTVECFAMGVSEADRLKLILSQLARENAELRKAVMYYGEMFGPMPVWKSQS